MLSAKEVAALAAKALDAKMGEDIRLIRPPGGMDTE